MFSVPCDGDRPRQRDEQCAADPQSAGQHHPLPHRRAGQHHD